MTEKDQTPDSPLLDKNYLDLDYGRQNLEAVNANPYEIVVAAAKEARKINDKAVKYLGPDFEIRPTNMALKKMGKGEVKFVYNNGEEEEKSGLSDES